VHLLIGLKATHCVADVVRELKKAATAWVHQQIRLPASAWQEGYAALTVSPSARPGVRAYVGNQEEHHREKSPLEELVELLQKAGVPYEPKCLD
jgi:hypothetical protein